MEFEIKGLDWPVRSVEVFDVYVGVACFSVEFRIDDLAKKISAPVSHRNVLTAMHTLLTSRPDSLEGSLIVTVQLAWF